MKQVFNSGQVLCRKTITRQSECFFPLISVYTFPSSLEHQITLTIISPNSTVQFTLYRKRVAGCIARSPSHGVYSAQEFKYTAGLLSLGIQGDITLEIQSQSQGSCPSSKNP